MGTKFSWEKNKINKQAAEGRRLGYLEMEQTDSKRRILHEQLVEWRQHKKTILNAKNEELRQHPRTCKIIPYKGAHFPGESRLYINMICKVLRYTDHGRVLVQMIEETNPNKCCGFPPEVVEFQ
jgi:hypothetical protein